MSLDIIDHGPIRELRLARPPVNALDAALCSALADAVARAADERIEGLILSGSARIFSAGMDVPQLLAYGSERARVRQTWSAFFDAARALAGSPLPVVAALTGHVPAGGCVLALCCDYRIMARSADPARPATIGLNEVQVGLTPPEGVQRLLRRAVGRQCAERMLVSGSLVSAELAAQIGLIDELSDAGQVGARARDWLSTLLQLPQAPLRRTRAIARADLIAALDPELIQLESFVDAWYDEDTQRALRTLLQRLGR